VTFGAIGEGFHNYHHVFPMDYNTSEFGWHVNITSLTIDLMALIGQVYDRKKMSHEAVFRRKNRTGDGSEGFGVLQPPKMD
jgi:stearoyl-CoA desaturase (delta-9 desaturase)